MDGGDAKQDEDEDENCSSTTAASQRRSTGYGPPPRCACPAPLPLPAFVLRENEQGTQDPERDITPGCYGGAAGYHIT